MAYTPRPWKDISNNTRRGPRTFRIVAPSKDDCQLWIDGESRTADQAHANARLIAAAPEMIKALEELVAEFETKSFEFALDHPGTLGLPESGGIIWAKDIIKGVTEGR